MIRKTLTIPLIAILIISAIPTVRALQIERPDSDINLKRVIGKGNTNGEASVILSAFVDDYDENASEYGEHDYMIFNVSMFGNTRKGITYSKRDINELYDWMFEDWYPRVGYQELELDSDDDCGVWVDLPDNFRFLFYGGRYRAIENGTIKKVWVCTNGFISFDVSNSTSGSPPYDIGVSQAPNAIIAPLWTDLIIDDQAKIITMMSQVFPHDYFVVMWKNAKHKSTGQRLTFAVALEGYPAIREGEDMYNGVIYMAYQNVTSVDGHFVWGIEDVEGCEGTGNFKLGSQLGSLDGKTFEISQNSPKYYIRHLTLKFEDQNYQNALYDISDNLIHGFNVRAKEDLPPQKNENAMFARNIIKASTLAYSLGGVVAGAYYGYLPLALSFTPYTLPIAFALLGWGVIDWYVLHQYNSIEWSEFQDSYTDPPATQCAYITVPTLYDVAVDASLDVVFYWILKDGHSSYHNLNITAELEYGEYSSPQVKTVTTSVGIEIGPDDNNDFSTADEIEPGEHGEDPMLWLGGYDTEDFYKIPLNDGNGIVVTMTPPYQQDFDLYLYDPNQLLKASSAHRGDTEESIDFEADSTGHWFIEVNHTAGQGFYNMSVTRSGWGQSGCPYIYVWNGEEYVVDNNILPTSEISNESDVKDYYKLEQMLVPTFEGAQFSSYSLQVREFENEHSYIDQARLFAVDHTSDVNIAVTSSGEILTYKNPNAPVSCIDNNGIDRLGEILQIDGNISDLTTYFFGEAGDYLILNFGRVDAENAKLILRDDLKSPIICIHVQVLDDTGVWQTVETVTPRNYWAVEAVNLTAYIPQDGDFMVRLLWTSPHRVDYVGLDTTPQDSFTVHSAYLMLAVHSSEGNVRWKLLASDNIYAELTPGQHITLTFILPNNHSEERTFIFYTEGHYHTTTP